MSPMRIRKMLDSMPFRPFTVRKEDGSSVQVQSKEYAWLKPGDRVLLVAVPRIEGAKDEGDFENHEIDVARISEMICKQNDANPWYKRLKELYYREPFRPFAIRTESGRSLIVTRPTQVGFTPWSKTIVFAKALGEGTEYVRASEIVEVTEKKSGRRGRSKV